MVPSPSRIPKKIPKITAIRMSKQTKMTMLRLFRLGSFFFFSSNAFSWPSITSMSSSDFPFEGPSIAVAMASMSLESRFPSLDGIPFSATMMVPTREDLDIFSLSKRGSATYPLSPGLATPDSSIRSTPGMTALPRPAVALALASSSDTPYKISSLLKMVLSLSLLEEDRVMRRLLLPLPWRLELVRGLLIGFLGGLLLLFLVLRRLLVSISFMATTPGLDALGPMALNFAFSSSSPYRVADTEGLVCLTEVTFPSSVTDTIPGVDDIPDPMEALTLALALASSSSSP